MLRVTVDPKLLRWARERAGLDVDALARRFPKLEAWEHRELRPTLKQLELYAKATHAPIGYFFLPEPPVEAIPIPDFRTLANAEIREPSPDLLDIVYLCQQRQEWYREYARSVGEEALSFVGSAAVTDDVEVIAADIRHALAFDLDERSRMGTWTEALRFFVTQADDLGILVMCSGVVGNNTSRRLDPEEFRGFALVNEFAPLVFVNGADTKAAQMFTLAHELAHIWLGQSALSDAQAVKIPDTEAERWCNQVAAEILVPLAVIRDEYSPRNELASEANRLARYFKVSTLVVLRRIYDAGGISRREFWQAYEAELDRLRAIPRRSGGNAYLSIAARVSKRFARALVVSTLEGQTLHRDAFRMLGISKLATFHKLVGAWKRWTNGISAGRQRIHPGEEPSLRPGFLPSILGLDHYSKCSGQCVQHRESR